MCQPRVFSHVNGDYHLDGGGCLSLVLGWSSSHHYVPVRNTSGQGSQRNNGPEQDQNFDNPLLSASLVGQKWDSAGGGGGGEGAPSKLLMEGVGLSFSFSVLSVEFTQFKAFQVER